MPDKSTFDNAYQQGRVFQAQEIISELIKIGNPVVIIASALAAV